MENITFTQLSVEELRAIIRQELKVYFEENPLNTKTRKPADDFLNAEQIHFLEFNRLVSP